MIHDSTLRWVITGLFVLFAAQCGLAILTKPRPWTMAVNHGWHLVMAVAMAAMAWPWGAQLPTTGPAVLFLLAALWFVAMAVVAAPARGRLTVNGYHALMMVATAWMYATMDPHLLSAPPATPMPGMEMPGMDMGAVNMPASSGHPVWFSAVNWLGAIGFAIAALGWTYSHFQRRQHMAIRCSLGNLGQAMMAAGMSILFLAALFQF